MASIPSFITREGYNSGAESNRRCWPYLRVSLRPSEPGEDTAVLDKDQVRALRDELDGWLERVDPELV